MCKEHHHLPLDGLRGIAISLVVLFHMFARWTVLTPWLAEYASLWPVKYGYLGVELFFLISGYLIAKSLESSKGFMHFAFKRWLRLFPSMLLASFLILTTAGLLSERPSGMPSWQDALPGMLFMHPYFFEKVFGMSVQPLEWAYWSLFVEVVFYAVFGLMYFLRKQLAVSGLAAIFLAAASYKFGIAYISLAPSIVIMKSIDACFIHFGWFYLGSVLYQRQKISAGLLGFMGTIFCLCIYTTVGNDHIGASMCILLYCLFYAGVRTNALYGVLTAKWLVWVGFISYPLYLIHENALIALTIMAHRLSPELAPVITPLPGLLIITAIAYLLARYGDLRRFSH